MSRRRHRVVVTLLAVGVMLATGVPAAHAAPITGTPARTVAAADAVGCSVRFEQWSTGYVAYVTVTGPAAGWSIPFTVPSGHRVNQAWNAYVTVSGQNGTASSTNWNGSIGSDQSTMFGLVATRPSGDTQLLTFPTCVVG